MFLNDPFQPAMSKQVRFAPRIIIHPPTFVPSSALSGYPAKKDRLRSPRQQSREPADRHGCHPLLETSAMTYDLRDPVSTATAAHNWLSTETLHQSAFNPSLSRITITSAYLPWTIKVFASNASYITLQDVFSSIHSALRTNITPTEFQLLPSNHHRKRATHAYQQRYRRLRHRTNSDKASEWEKHAGMKRVDFLMDHTKFLGISSKGCKPNDQWYLHVATSTVDL
jgi:hypothetical protein